MSSFDHCTPTLNKALHSMITCHTANSPILQPHPVSQGPLTPSLGTLRETSRMCPDPSWCQPGQPRPETPCACGEVGLQFWSWISERSKRESGKVSTSDLLLQQFHSPWYNQLSIIGLLPESSGGGSGIKKVSMLQLAWDPITTHARACTVSFF